MSELVLRGHHNDHRVFAELLLEPVLPTTRAVRRTVVDATLAARTPLFAQAAREGAVQHLVDPQTHLIMDVQAASDSWARLPYGIARAVPPNQLSDATASRMFVEQVINFQLDHGATAVIPPYLHLTADNGQTARVQEQWWDMSSQFLERSGRKYSLLPLISIDLSAVSLEMNSWSEGLGRLARVAASIADGPIALALSSGSTTVHSIHKRAQIWRRAAARHQLLAWHAGAYGPLAVTLGATGYEVGLCSGENCNMPQSMRSRRPTGGPSSGAWVGVYVDTLGRSLSVQAVKAMAKEKRLQADLSCVDPGCCSRGLSTMMGPGRRQHSFHRRVEDLQALDAITARGWKLHHLERKAGDAAAAARRIHDFADARGLRVGAQPAEFEAMQKVLQGLRATARVAVA